MKRITAIAKMPTIKVSIEIALSIGPKNVELAPFPNTDKTSMASLNRC